MGEGKEEKWKMKLVRGKKDGWMDEGTITKEGRKEAGKRDERVRRGRGIP